MFCKNCGEILTDTEVACRQCGFAIGTGSKFCEQCGSETPSYAVVCDLCGRKVERDDASQFAAQYASEPAPVYSSQNHTAKRGGTYAGFAAHQQAPVYPAASNQPNAMRGASPYPTPVSSTEGIWLQEQKAAPVAPANACKRGTAAILGFVLGMLGVHDFYLGKQGAGIAHLMLTIFGGLPISWFWAVVESIDILSNKNYKDGNGNLLE